MSDERTQWRRDNRKLSTSSSLCKYTAILCSSVQVKGGCQCRTSLHFSSYQYFVASDTGLCSSVQSLSFCTALFLLPFSLSLNLSVHFYFLSVTASSPSSLVLSLLSLDFFPFSFISFIYPLSHLPTLSFTIAPSVSLSLSFLSLMPGDVWECYRPGLFDFTTPSLALWHV